MIVRFLDRLEKQSRLFIALLAIALIAGVGILDILTGYELAFSLFYVIPISVTTWLTNRWGGIAVSVVSAVVWLGADLVTGHVYSQPSVPVWNSLIRFSFFLIITSLLFALKGAMEREKELARTDHLTGAVNTRLFYDLVQMEINRLQRYDRPFTLAFIDLDNFKSVNDQFGHPAGDQVLCAIVSYAKVQMRKSDIIARLGGDEFAVLLPEASQEAAQVALTKLQQGLLEEMRQRAWPVTFSIGAITCTTAPPSSNSVIRMADDLMYSVKHGSKDGIAYATYAGE